MKIYDKEELELRISNYLSDDCTEQEKKELLTYLAANEEATKTFQEMSAAWALASIPAFAKQEDVNLSQIKERISFSTTQQKASWNTFSVWAKVAAAVILLIGCNYFWYTYTENLTEIYTDAQSTYEIKVPAGSRTNVMLPDGTEVALNSGSVLRYRRGFGVRERNVTLDGEGYFKVAKNKEIPFQVNTNDIRVMVVGTIFNVSAYNDDNYVMVSLLEGRVDLSASSGGMMKLFPNDQVFYDKKTKQMKRIKTNVAKSYDWLDGGFTFDNTSFANIARRLERKFQVKIRIESERLKREHFSGCFNSNQTIGDILKEINVEKQYIWEVSGDTIFITDKRKEVR